MDIGSAHTYIGTRVNTLFWQTKLIFSTILFFCTATCYALAHQTAGKSQLPNTMNTNIAKEHINYNAQYRVQ
jgi:hypothetical protein